jgi:TonB family protein
VYPLLVAVYQELIGKLPKCTPLAPAQLASFSKRSLNKPVAPKVPGRALPYLTAAGACALLLLGLFGGGHFLAQRVGSQRIAGLNLPQLPATAVVEAAPSIEVTPPPEPDTLAVIPGKETLVISKAGLSRGPRLIRQIGPSYPELAKQQKISGVVKLEITVAEDGSVWKADVLSGDPLLAQGAFEAVTNWLYQPALVNGKPSSSTTEVEIKFDLDAEL